MTMSPASPLPDHPIWAIPASLLPSCATQAAMPGSASSAKPLLITPVAAAAPAHRRPDLAVQRPDPRAGRRRNRVQLQIRMKCTWDELAWVGQFQDNAFGCHSCHATHPGGRSHIELLDGCQTTGRVPERTRGRRSRIPLRFAVAQSRSDGRYRSAHPSQHSTPRECGARNVQMTLPVRALAE